MKEEMEEKMKEYIIIDTYAGEQVIGKYDTKEEAFAAAEQFKKDTDGECHLLIGYLKEAQP